MGTRVHAHKKIMHVKSINVPYLEIITTVASSNGGFLSLNSVNHMNEINVRVLLPHGIVAKCPFHCVVILTMH